MTAGELHDLFGGGRGRDVYDGGFTTDDEGCHFEVTSDSKDVGVELALRVVAHGFGGAAVFYRLTPGEARELSLSLDLAADAAEGIDQ